MTQNLNELYAINGHPGTGRDMELQQMMLGLLSYETPNLLLTGAPGVGKTTLVHMLASLIAQGLCPMYLTGKQIIAVNTNELLAGPGYRGVTEEKFQKLIDFAVNQQKILFFDEGHTITHLGEMSNGSTPGFGNMLKPYLTSGKLRVILATTTEEVKQINDSALLRRFIEVEVGEPSDSTLIRIAEKAFELYTQSHLQRMFNIEVAIQVSKTLKGSNPAKLTRLIDLAVAAAKLQGLTEVTTDHLDAALAILKTKPTASQW